MGLTYPVDIDAWAAWQKRQNTLRWACLLYTSDAADE